MKTTEQSEAALNRAKDSWAAYEAGLAASEARRQEFERREKEANAFLRGRALLDTLAAREARNSVKKIAREIFGQEGTVKTYAILNEAQTLAGLSAEPAPESQTIARNGDVLTYTPLEAEIAPVIEKLGLDQATAPRSADFKVRDGRVIAVTEAFGAGGMHPVVALVMADGSKHARALVEFAS